MDVGTLIETAVATLTSGVTEAFAAVTPFILLVGGGFAAWRYGKRILGKV